MNNAKSVTGDRQRRLFTSFLSVVFEKNAFRAAGDLFVAVLRTRIGSDVDSMCKLHLA